MAKNMTPAVASGAMEKYTPTIFVDLTKSDVDELKGIKAGDKVKVSIVGKVRSLTTRENNKDKSGSIELESKDVVIKKMDGEFDKLMDEDDG